MDRLHSLPVTAPDPPGLARTRALRRPARVLDGQSEHAPHCLFTVSVDFCPAGEHRVLARVPYREAAERFRGWLADTAPAVAAAAGPDRVDDLPERPRPVVADPGGEGMGLF